MLQSFIKRIDIEESSVRIGNGGTFGKRILSQFYGLWTMDTVISKRIYSFQARS